MAGGITTSVGALDVQSIVNQLIAIDAQPLQASQKKLSGYNTQLSDMGKISSALSALQTAMTSLSSGSFLQAFKVSTSDSSMANASISSGGIGGTYALKVNALAQSRQLVFDQFNGGVISDSKAAITSAPDELKFTVNGEEQTIKLRDNPGDMVSLQSMSDRINAQGNGVASSVVKTDGGYKLVVTSTASGTDNNFTISGGGSEGGAAGSTLGGLTQSTTALAESRAASNAQLTVNGVSVSSGSNKLSDVVPGAEIDIYKLGDVTVTLNQDTAGIAKNVQNFVDAYNQVLSTLSSARSGSMKGNASILSVQQQLQTVLTTPIPGADPVSSYAYLSQIGVAIQKDGTLKLDQTAFNDALKKDPTAVRNLFGNSNSNGIAQLMSKEINSMLGPSGIIQSSKDTINSRISIEQASQDSLSARLDVKRAQYVQQYTNLNTLLANMQSATSSLSDLLK
ncbi:flagellar filament capping protein FliD [Neisseriaceae bacterium TC5R-5]|nr:flagellar filament capping protein FliD [Neisseriaceae bacterium TC5R-5]